MSGIRAGMKIEPVGRGIEDNKSIYQYTYGQGDDKTARIWYNNDGSINADNTYNEWYNKKHKLGSFAKSDDDDAKKSVQKRNLNLEEVAYAKSSAYLSKGYGAARKVS